MYPGSLFARDGPVRCFCDSSGGFEGQGVWYLLLLPGSLPAFVLSDQAYKLAPSVEPVINWVLIISFNFVWYWGISYAFIKVFRAGGWKLGSPEF
jgi:hypothetical protein